MKALNHATAQKHFKARLFDAIDGLQKFHAGAVDAGDSYDAVIEVSGKFDGDSDTNLGAELDLTADIVEGVADANAALRAKRSKQRAHDNYVSARVEIHSKIGNG